MATNIVSKQSGSTYHQTSNATAPGSAYRIPAAIWIAIRSRAPSWDAGRAASRIADAEIEIQRQEFIATNGAECPHSV